jgi:hypothetical protein
MAQAAVAVNTLTDLASILKELYPDELYREVVYTDRPLFGMLNKREDFGSDTMVIPVKHTNPQGRSNTFADAQTVSGRDSTPGGGTPQAARFKITRINDYHVATINGEAIEATTENEYSFISALQDITEGAMNVLAQALETSLYRGKGGALAQVHGTTAPSAVGVITLAEEEEVALFELGMHLEAGPNQDGTSLHADAGGDAEAIVSAVDISNGTITTKNAAGTENDFTAAVTWNVDDYLFQLGDATKAVSGLEDWLPSAKPAATAFFGVDRTVHQRLYGVIHDATADPTMEAGLIRGQSITGVAGKGPKVVVMNNAQYRKLIEELGAKKEYASPVFAKGPGGPMADIGFEAIKVWGDAGEMRVVSARKCPVKIGFGLNLDTWVLATLRAPIRPVVEDGLRLMRLAGDDGYEMRLVFRGQLASNWPGANTHFKFASP